jgi:hypothetical protein
VQRGAGGGRTIENHHELLEALNLMPTACYGRWEVVSPVTAEGGGGMQRVARVFASAAVVVAPHGGTLANLLFSRGSARADGAGRNEALQGGGGAAASRPGTPYPTPTRVLELLPAFRPNLCYERLCRALGMPYLGMVVPDTAYSQPMRVDVARVLVSLRTLLRLTGG